MTSNMLAGERRWATARRGGMTVLGKVAVPKPLNLPSQRLENHGMDPNVEIVPKGTLSWGSRSSSSSSNPWVSSSLSPGADGGTVSPSHLSGRPSSGGSGTRPSTAGSDRIHEPVASAWGSNSRPSSASGTLSSNQTSTASLRPRSAENRPNSSQLSRFAEPVTKSSTAWGPSGTAERLGVRSSKDDGFSLSSGDFPTLGSEKDDSVKNTEPKDHSRPSSASGRIAQTKEDTTSQADVKQHGTVNTWRADAPRSAEDDIHPNMEKWQGEPHQYFNANSAPQHFDSWRGPPMNGPGGVWYGGRPRGPTFGGPIPPGGFPMEPFPYYRPPPPLAGSQPVPPPGAGGPRGPHPKNGDLYRSQMPDAYARPGMPFRPGFYPGPPGRPGPPGPMPFEGYYGPPMGYCNSERDIPYMGAGPPVYNGYPAPPDIGNSHGRGAGRGPSGRTLSEQVEPDHFGDTQGQKRVPLKNHDLREEGENREHNMQPNVSYSGKTRLPMISSRKSEWGAEDDTEEPMFSKRTKPAENSSGSYEYRGHSADGVKVKSFEGMGNVKAIDDSRTNKSESASSLPPEMQAPLASGGDSSLPAATKNSALMHKIDGLNAKIRVSDGRHDAPSAYRREDERNVSQEVHMKINNYTGEVGNPAGSFGRIAVSRDLNSGPHEVTVPVGDKPVQPMPVVSRRLYHGGQGKVDQQGKGRFNSQEADGWRRKPLSTEPSSAVAATNIESTPNVHVHCPNIVGEVSENSTIKPTGKIEGDSVETYDSTDIQAQRAKMRELAKQRALQLQKEEEERTREQKAKALAKLEELNRRALGGEPAKQKPDATQAKDDIQGEQDESGTIGEPVPPDLKFQEPGLDLVSNPDGSTVAWDRNATEAGESVEFSRNLPLDMRQTGSVESNMSPLPMQQDAHDGGAKKVTSQFNDGGFPKHKRAGYKQKQNIPLQKSLNEKPVSSGVASEAQEDHSHVASVDITPHECPSGETKQSGSSVNTPNTVVEPSPHQRRKNNRGGKNKHKLDETLPVPALPPVGQDINPVKESMEDSSSNLDSSVSTLIEPDTGVQAQEVCSSLPNEESQNRSNQWKPHPSRRLPRNQQANRFPDKLHGNDTVVWAPVRTHNKAKGSIEASQKSVQESATNNTTTGDNMAQNSSKGKRAEMERYVPKPVAKEMAQQGSIPPLSSPVSSRPNEAPEREQSGSVSSATAYVGPTVETNEGEGHHNKHKKDHGTWRQRGSTDPSHVKGAHIGPSHTSEPTKETQQSKEPVELVKNDRDSANAETKYPLVKDQGATGRGKRHTPRGPRATTGNNNPDLENAFSGEIDIVSKDNRTFVEKTSSHWQPKSQHGNKTAGSESVTTDINRLPKKDHPQHKPQAAPRHDKEESIVDHHEELNREKKTAPPKARPYSPNQDLPADSGESAPAFNTNDQFDRNAPSGSRRNGRQNNRYVRGHESRGDWSSGHDNRPHNAPAFRDNNNRHRQTMHYEYQPVGPSKGNKPEKVEETGDRGQGQSRRGNYYRRQSATEI